MPRELFANNAGSTLAVAVSSNTQASLTVQTGKGALFPAPLFPNFFMVTLDDGTNVEICKCVARSGDVLTVLRGQEGTTAQASFSVTVTKVELRVTKAALDKITFSILPSLKYIRPTANVVSWNQMATTLPTVVNSQVAGTLTNSSWREGNERIRLTQANSAQNPIEFRVAQPTIAMFNGFRATVRFGFAQAPSSSHFFAGWVNTTGAVNSVHPPTSITNGVVIGYDVGGLNSNLAIYASAGGTAVKTDLGSYFTVQTPAWYEMELECQPADTTLKVTARRLDVSSIADVSSIFVANIPSSFQWLSPMVHGSTMVTSGMAVELGGFYWES